VRIDWGDLGVPAVVWPLRPNRHDVHLPVDEAESLHLWCMFLCPPRKEGGGSKRKSTKRGESRISMIRSGKKPGHNDQRGIKGSKRDNKGRRKGKLYVLVDVAGVCLLCLLSSSML
jgi:hypothetical protein